MPIDRFGKPSPGHIPFRRVRHFLASLVSCLVLASAANGQIPSPDTLDPAPPARQQTEPGGGAPARVQVNPESQDPEIRRRIQDILEATEWFTKPQVDVRDGVVFLSGQTTEPDHKIWAGNLARNTQDVAAVVNRIEIDRPDVWNFGPSLERLRDLWRSLVWTLPFLILSLFILIIAGLSARLAALATRRTLRNRLTSPLLRSVLAKCLAILVFIIGLYVILRVAGLTGAAFTVIGGTGLLGLILGIAFREITENFLASIFLSAQHPFRNGDLILIDETLGYVQRLTTRATLLMTLDGNHVQIPNITVYRSRIRNYSSNRNRREDFTVGIGYADSIAHAQAVAYRVLRDHPAVLHDPEPWVLVDSLGKATVNLRIYFWLDGSRNSWLKVRSSVIRLIKRAFQGEGISMPDEAREVIFPDGVDVRIEKTDQVGARPPRDSLLKTLPATIEETDQVSTASEGDLRSEAGEIEAQARTAWIPEESQDLLQESADDTSGKAKRRA